VTRSSASGYRSSTLSCKFTCLLSSKVELSSEFQRKHSSIMPFIISSSETTAKEYSPKLAKAVIRLDLSSIVLTLLALVFGLANAVQRSDNYSNWDIAGQPSNIIARLVYILIGIGIPCISLIVYGVRIYAATSRTLRPSLNIGVCCIMFLAWMFIFLLQESYDRQGPFHHAGPDAFRVLVGVNVSSAPSLAYEIFAFILAIAELAHLALDARAIDVRRKKAAWAARLASEE
jgi:hypothetical protein